MMKGLIDEVNQPHHIQRTMRDVILNTPVFGLYKNLHENAKRISYGGSRRYANIVLSLLLNRSLQHDYG